MPVVSGEYFSEAAYSYNGQGLTYDNYDCTHFTNLVRRTCGLSNLSQGSNNIWRSRALLWKGTIAEARAKFNNNLPAGLYLFHSIPDSDPDADPEHYGYGDQWGDVNHVGIYTGIGLGVMQSGGYAGTGVHDSPLRGYFNLAACPTGIDYTGRSMPTIPNPAQYRKFYISPDDYNGSRIATEADPTDEQKQNANCIKSRFSNENWTLQSICAMIGNMQYDSGINPAFITPTNRHLLPSGASDLTQLPNYYMQFYYGEHYADPNINNYGLGLCINSNTTTVNHLKQSYVVGFGIVNHALWYDGWYQCSRIVDEHNRDVQGQSRYFDTVDVNGVTYSFHNFPMSTNIPDLAEAWAKGYDRTTAGISSRKDNALYWYDYFTGPDAPQPIPEPAPEPYVIPERKTWMLPILARKKKGVKRPCRII